MSIKLAMSVFNGLMAWVLYRLLKARRAPPLGARRRLRRTLRGGGAARRAQPARGPLPVRGGVHSACPRRQVDLAIVFGFLHFVLNFIPSVGPLLATLIPLPVVLVSPETQARRRLAAAAGRGAAGRGSGVGPCSESGSGIWDLRQALDVLLCVGLPILSHVVIGHVIEPKLMGDSLELHPITARAPPPRLAYPQPVSRPKSARAATLRQPTRAPWASGAAVPHLLGHDLGPSRCGHGPV